MNKTNPIMQALSYLNASRLPARVNRIKYFLIPSLYLFPMSATLLLALKFIDSAPLAIAAAVLVAILVCAFFMINIFLITIKRLHDLNYSGWWMLLSFIPILSIAFELALLFTKGTKGKNRFGPEPEKASMVEYILTTILTPIRIFLFAAVIFYYFQKWPN